jgi:hypothetical protein
MMRGPLEIFGADKRPDEIDQQAGRNGAAEKKIEHGRYPAGLKRA